MGRWHKRRACRQTRARDPWRRGKDTAAGQRTESGAGELAGGNARARERARSCSPHRALTILGAVAVRRHLPLCVLWFDDVEEGEEEVGSVEKRRLRGRLLSPLGGGGAARHRQPPAAAFPRDRARARAGGCGLLARASRVALRKMRTAGRWLQAHQGPPCRAVRGIQAVKV